MAKERLDVLLVNRGLAASREKAKAIIMSGSVYVDGQKEDKAGQTFPEEANIEVRGSTLKYVSRGGLKLEKALKVFHIDPTGMHCIDCGASTGGFTDVLLKNGAEKVFAVDVGYGQLAWSLRQDERVVNMERTNIQHIIPEQITEALDLAVADLSFISLKLVLPAISSVLKDKAELVCLIKPQFEAGKDEVGKKGVVRDEGVHLAVIESILDFVPTIGLTVLGLDYSPIKGPEGNIEYLCYMKKGGGEAPDINAAGIVEASHELL